jgi:hypothetical protein
MSSALPTPVPCPDGCTPITVAVPGTAGTAGAAGAAGTAGLSSFTTLSAQFTMPAVSATATATVASNAWMAYGQVLAIGDPAAPSPYAYVRVGTKTGTTQVGLINLEDGAGAYPDNVAPGTVFPVGTILSPGGVQGPAGAAGAAGAPSDATYWVTVADGDLSAEVDMSTKGTGYLINTAGVPSTTATIPLADINTGAATTAQVLKPNGTGSAVAGQVSDDEVEYTETAIAATSIDWATGRTFYKTLAAATAFTFANLVAGKQIIVVVRQGTGTSYTATWPAATEWAGGTEPTMTTTSNGYAVYSFYNRGGTVLGTVLNNVY